MSRWKFPSSSSNQNPISSLLHSCSTDRMEIQVHYNDHQHNIAKATKIECSIGTSILPLIEQFLKIVQLYEVNPKSIIIIHVIDTNLKPIPGKYENMTLKELGILNGSILYLQSIRDFEIDDNRFLSVCSPHDGSRRFYKWNKNTDTLGLLFSYVIHKFEIESIEVEHINLLSNGKELGKKQDFNKLLVNLDIKDNSFIFVKIILPTLLPTSLGKVNNYSDGASANTILMPKSIFQRLTIPIELMLQCKNAKDNQTVYFKSQFSTTSTITDAINAILAHDSFKYLSLDDITLVSVNFDDQHFIPINYKSMTLGELKIKSGFTLYFESTNSCKSCKPMILRIRLQNNNKIATFEWYKNITTLETLTNYVIKEFSLQSIPRKCINIIKDNTKLDNILDFNRLLSDLNFTNYETIIVKLDARPSLSDGREENVTIYCSCDYKDFSLNVSTTITVNRLAELIADRIQRPILLPFELYNVSKRKLIIDNMNQLLSSLGISPNETVYASIRVISDNTVKVVYKLNEDDKRMFTMELYNTVGEMIERIKAFRKTLPSSIEYRISSGSIIIDDKQLNRSFNDFGIKQGETINVVHKHNMSLNPILSETNYYSLYKIGESKTFGQFSPIPIGLKNLGKTCYMNSSLQCLAHVKPLTDFFLHGIFLSELNDDHHIETEWNDFYMVGTITGTYVDLLRSLWLKPRNMNKLQTVVEPTHMKQILSILSSRFKYSQQHDAEEFLTLLLENIDKELQGMNRDQSSTIIQDLFQGENQSIVTCENCNQQERVVELFNILRLPISEFKRTFNIKHIRENGKSFLTTMSLSEFGQVRDLVEEFKIFRDSFYEIIPMANNIKLSLETPLYKLPSTELLFIEQNNLETRPFVRQQSSTPKKITLESCFKQFFRLEYLETHRICRQNSCRKHTRATKQIKCFSLPSILIIQLKRFSYANGASQKTETFVDYPINGLDLTSFVSSRTRVIYDLFAVCKHIGSTIDSGHYVACAQRTINGESRWYKFDDDRVLSHCPETEIVSKDAYLLFYRQRIP